MAEETLHNDDVGELRGQVRGIISTQAELGRNLENGLRNLGEQIQRVSERQDQRLVEQSLRTDAKFEAMAQQNLAQLGAKGNQQWQIFAYIGSTILGLASVGAVFYGLTKAPIDQAFQRQDAATGGNAGDIKTLETVIIPTLVEKTRDSNDKLREYADKKFADYVPRAEVMATMTGLQKVQEENIKRINELEILTSRSMVDRDSINKTLAKLENNVVPRSENENRFTDVLSRINSLFDRMNLIQTEQRQGGTANDRINQIQSAVNDLVKEFIVIPQFPKHKEAP